MTTYNTGNPLGSQDPRDLFDNAGNLDHFLQSEQETYQDRLGQARKSWRGFEMDFSRFLSDNSIQTFSSWEDLGTFAGTHPRQTVIVRGDDGSHIDPVTSAAVPNSGQYVWVNDVWQWLSADPRTDIRDLRRQMIGPVDLVQSSQLYRDAIDAGFGIVDQSNRLGLTINSNADLVAGGGLVGQFIRSMGVAAGYRDALDLSALIYGMPTADGRYPVLLWEVGGEIDFVPSQSLIDRIVSGIDPVTWRGQIDPIGPLRRDGMLTVAAVQDGDGRVYDAGQLVNGENSSFVARSTKTLEFVGFCGQSNSGCPRPYLFGSYDRTPYPGHALQFSGAGQACTGFVAQTTAVLQDFVPAHDADPVNNYLATLAAHAIEGLGYRSPFAPSPALLAHTAWSGGQPLSHFQQGASAWWGNALQARAQSKVVAAKYGRAIEEKWIVWVQGESGEYGSAAYQASLNAFIDAFRPAARAAMGQAAMAKFALVQTNIGDAQGPEAADQESVNLAQWHVGKSRFADGVRLIGPMYQCPIVLDPTDNIHTSLIGRLMLAEMIADAYTQENRFGADWKALQPIAVVRNGVNIDVQFEGPAGTLAFDVDFVGAIANKGFAYVDSNGAQAIQSVNLLSSDTVRIALAAVPTGNNPKLQYAMGSARDNARDSWSSGRGQLMIQTARESYFKRAGFAVPAHVRHYCIKFEMGVA